MKILTCSLSSVLCFAMTLAAAGGSPEQKAPTVNPTASELPPEIKSFAEAKEKQARELARKLDVEVSPDLWAFFNAATQGNGPQVQVLWDKLRPPAGQQEGAMQNPAVNTPVWQTVLETDLAVVEFTQGEPKYSFAFGKDVIASIPKGSIYFGGTDPGRGLVTALSVAHAQGDPFFTLTQNALADNTYLEYLRAMYGARLHLPTTDDSQKVFAEYINDAQKRLKENKLKPGEDVRIIDERIQVSGQVAVMAINALLAKIIFDLNTNREFYIEESFPLDWMYPHLTPHGLILKIHRQPLASIPPEMVERDLQFWTERLRPMLGGWLQRGTSVKEICDFTEKVFLQKDLAGFTGDPKFVRNENACKLYSKLRSSIGGLYAWRANAAQDSGEKKRMLQAADLAFRQALALCPFSPEAVFRYVNILVQEKRLDDALLITQTALQLDSKNNSLKSLADQLQSLAKSQAPSTH